MKGLWAIIRTWDFSFYCGAQNYGGFLQRNDKIGLCATKIILTTGLKIG